MSLNGLDEQNVQDAYQAAVGESGGWFLLKYTSRDAVELLESGTNGVAAARNAITSYSETSPLYGLITHRRRKILIKYMPEGTSRLLQARTAVHFQDILERYSPYETVLEISDGDALNDTSLAASFHLRTAAPSTPTHRLDEIREDGEDGGSGGVSGPDMFTRGLSNASHSKSRRRAEPFKRQVERVSPVKGDMSARSEAPSVAAAAAQPSVSQFLVREDPSGLTSVTSLKKALLGPSAADRPNSACSSTSEGSRPKTSDLRDSASQTTQEASEATDATDAPSSPEAEGASLLHPSDASAWQLSLRTDAALSISERMSSETDRVTLKTESPQTGGPDFDWFKYYDERFGLKPKLSPRPVTASDKLKRPAVARVSALPPNHRPAVTRQEQSRPSSSPQRNPFPSAHKELALDLEPVARVSALAPPPVPLESDDAMRPVSRGSIKSTHSHKTMMTPDKLRLMKAVELRKRQLRKSEESQQTKRPAVEQIPVPKPVLEVVKPTESEQEQGMQKADCIAEEDIAPQSGKADSGIDINYDQAQESISKVPGPVLLEPVQPVDKDVFLQRQESATATDSLSSDSEQTFTLSTTTESLSSDVEQTFTLSPTTDSLSSDSEETLTPSTNIATAPTSEVCPPETTPEESQASTGKTCLDDQPSDGVDHSARASSGPKSDLTFGRQTPTQVVEPSQDEVERNDIEDGASAGTLDVPVSPTQTLDLAERRHGYVEPLALDSNADNNDEIVSDDDDFLEELHSAKVEEAWPVTVSRSGSIPLQGTRRPSAESGSVRSINITKMNTLPSPQLDEPASAEPLTAPTLEVTEPPANLSSRNVSSEISKRIQALADNSSREGASMEHSGRSASRPKPPSFRRQSGNRIATEVESPQTASRFNVQHDPLTDRSSMSVSARIVRANGIDESGVTSLQPSEITINQPRGAANAEGLSLNLTKTSPPVSPLVPRFSGEFRTLHSATANRLGKHKPGPPPAVDEFGPPPASRAMSNASSTSTDELVPPKEGGRAGRFLKRMSTMGASKRKNGSRRRPSLMKMTNSESHLTPSPPPTNSNASVEKLDMPPAIVVGDLNVQFPDSLLWKRRITTIDEAGNLQFAIAQAMEIHKGVAFKNYPLADFRVPFAPDRDCEELPHSIILEFLDGSFLQAACEDAMTQRQVLHLLKTYWKAWTAGPVQ